MTLTDKQIAFRRTGITAGDIRALVGEDPHGRGPHDVWLAKLGYDKAKPMNDAMALGHEIEPIILRRLVSRRGVELEVVDPDGMTRAHPEQAHHIATPDGFFTDGDLAEAKLVGEWMREGWGEDGTDEIPPWVVCQVTWQLHVTMRPVCHVGALLGTSVRTYRIERDADIEGLLVETADAFWHDHVLTHKSPPIDGSTGSRRMLEAVYARCNGMVLKAGPEFETLAGEYFAAKAAKEVAEQRQEHARQALMGLLGEADGVTGDGWRCKYAMRKAYTVQRSEYTVAAGRHWDMRPTKGKGK